MNIKSAKFIVSNQNAKDCPKSDLPEYAFIGRSNVGKSSLINMLTNNKKLAKTSSKPGKTRLINHFLIDSSWHLVDLPGYGYARASKSEKKNFQKLITDYFINRNQLISAFILVDVRHEAQKIDIEFMRWLTINKIAFSIVFTKIDKLGSSALMKQIARYKKKLLTQWEELPPVFMTSAEGRTGREEVLRYLDIVHQSITPDMYGQ